MKKIKIAVIDTGVDINDNEIKNNIRFDKELQIGDFEKRYKTIADIHSHGTFCAKTILSICKDVLIYPIKIFDDDGITSSLNLVEALEKVLHTDINVINISASTTNCTYEKELEEVCRKLYEEGKIIICSQHNDRNDNSSIPTKFKTVIGVKGIDEIFKDIDYSYNPQNELQIYGNNKEKLLKFKDEITHFGQNSRAAAVFSGIVANLIKENGYKTDKIENLIIKNSIDTKSLSTFSKFKEIYYDEEQIQIAKKLVILINNKFAVRKIDLQFLKEYSLLNNFTDIGRHNAYEFLLEINKEFKTNIDYRNIFIYDLEYLNHIVEIIQKNLKDNKSY